MKRMRKIAGILLAMVMVLGMGLTAFAADTLSHTITVKQNENDKAEHTYEAYQIFAGDLAENPEYRDSVICTKEEHAHDDSCKTGDEVTCGKEEHTHTRECYGRYNAQYILSNIVWGSGVTDGEALLEELKTDAEGVFSGAFDSCTTAADVARALSEFNNTSIGESGPLDFFASIVSKYLSATKFTATGTGDVAIDVTGSGYYLVKDAQKDTVTGEEAAYTRILLEVVGDSTMVVKSEVPSGEKDVFYQGADAYNHPEYVENYVPNENLDDANYAGIGDHATFRIKSKVPNYAGYDYYFFVMNDTMAEGLTFDGADSVTVTVGGKALTRGTLNAAGEAADNPLAEYYVYPNGDHSFRLAFTDIMQYTVGDEIIVTYSATVNEDAIIGVEGNENAWSLDYSQDPNFDYGGSKDEKHPGLPVEDEDIPLGKTPEQKTLTYLTELDITKYANAVLEENLLAGAEFTLTGTSYQVVLDTVEHYVVDENGAYYKLLDGSYTTDEPSDDQYTSIGQGDENTTKGYLKETIDNEDVYYIPADRTEYAGREVYMLVKGSAGLYADVETKYNPVTETTTRLVPSEVSIRLTTDAVTGRISFKGLGEGKYTLTETKTPAGFNTIEPIEFEIKFIPPVEVTEGNETCTWEITGWPTDENGNSAITNTNGIFAADIINVNGALLPSTGGIGTTIFYVTGSILVLAAVVLLVTRKRMSKEK